MEKKKNAKSIKETFSELDEIISKLENSETSLDEAFKLYKNGMKLCRQCNDSIDKIEKELVVLEESSSEDSSEDNQTL